MNKKAFAGAAGAVGVAALVGGSQGAAQAQALYPDLTGQYMNLSGSININTLITISALLGIVKTSTSINTSLGVGPAYGSNPLDFQFNNTNPGGDDHDLTAYIGLPSISLGSDLALNLPTLTLSANFNENTGSYSTFGSAPTTSLPPIAVSIQSLGTVSITATFKTPSATFVGQAVAGTGTGSGNLLTITNIGGASIWLNPVLHVSSGVGTVTVTISYFQTYLQPWQATQVPGPSALAVFLPGMAGSLAMMRRRRRAKRN